MRQVTVDVHISAPREDVFDFVADLGGRPAWTDHYLKDYRLARPNPYGLGAAARFVLRAPLAKEYAELAIVEYDRPRRIVEEARVGRRGRNRSLAVWEFEREAAGLTHVELTTYSEPASGAPATRVAPNRMPAPMSLAGKTIAAACALVLAAGLAACGKEEKQGVD